MAKADTKETIPVRSERVVSLILARHPPPEWACFSELMNAPGLRHDRVVDVACFNTWPSRAHRVAYEVKVNRWDFARELNDPSKRKFAEEHFHECYFACGPGVAKEEELPEGWGLLLASETKLRRVVIAKHRKSPKELSWLAVIALLRRAAAEADRLRHAVYHLPDGEPIPAERVAEVLDQQLKTKREILDRGLKELAERRDKLELERAAIRAPLTELALAVGEHHYREDPPTVEQVRAWIEKVRRDLISARFERHALSGALDVLKRLIGDGGAEP